MSRLYKRGDSSYYWWTTRHKGRRLRRSTKMSQKHLAKQLAEQWDLKLAAGELDFLRLSHHPSTEARAYFEQYLRFLSTRKTEKIVLTAEGVLKKFSRYLEEQGVRRLDEINVTVLNEYIDWLDCAPKTKKNHLGVISLMFDQAIKEDILTSNLARQATLPRISEQNKARPLEGADLVVIRQGAGSWSLFYEFLLHSGLRAGDAAMLTHGNIDRKKGAIVSFVRKSRRVHEFPLAEVLLKQIPEGRPKDEPLFPTLYTENERRLNNNLAKPRKYLQTLLKLAGRPKATLHSFRVTFNNILRDLGLSIEDRQILMAHSSSETTKIYTHPNFELAAEFINRLPEVFKMADPSATKRDQNVTKT